MNPFDANRHALSVNRRTFLTQSAYGLGGIAFALLHQKLTAASVATPTAAPGAPGTLPPGWNGALREAHFPVKAKRVIYLCMAGGPSQFETFDWKPKLKELDGQAFPESFTKGQQLAQLQNATLKARGAFTVFSTARHPSYTEREYLSIRTLWASAILRNLAGLPPLSG